MSQDKHRINVVQWRIVGDDVYDTVEINLIPAGSEATGQDLVSTGELEEDDAYFLVDEQNIVDGQVLTFNDRKFRVMIVELVNYTKPDNVKDLVEELKKYQYTPEEKAALQKVYKDGVENGSVIS